MQNLRNFEVIEPHNQYNSRYLPYLLLLSLSVLLIPGNGTVKGTAAGAGGGGGGGWANGGIIGGTGGPNLLTISKPCSIPVFICSTFNMTTTIIVMD